MTAGARIEVALPAELLERLVDEVTARVLSELAGQASGGRWLTGAKAAAEYLGCSPRRIYGRLPELPHVKDEGRLMFNTAAPACSPPLPPYSRDER